VTELNVAHEELADLNGVLSDYDRDTPEPGSPEWLTYAALLNRQADLLHEIRLLEGHADLEITLVGGAEADHRVRADFLGKFIWDLQAALGAIAQTFVHGERGTRGVLPRDVLNASTLRVAPSAPGSFVLLIDGPFERAAQLTIEGQEELPPFDEALGSLVELVAASERADNEAIGRVLAEIGSRRALVHIQGLVHRLTGSGTSASVIQRGPITGLPREVRLTIQGALRLEGVLATTVQTTTTTAMTGRLSGVLWRSGIFELEAEVDGPVIRGRIANALRVAVQARFDTVVDAVLERTTTILADGEEHLTWRLVGLDPMLQVADAEEPRRLPAPRDPDRLPWTPAARGRRDRVRCLRGNAPADH